MVRGARIDLYYTAAMDSPAGARDALRREIAALAARLIADSGLDYGDAKSKAARQVLGEGRIPRNAMPDNDEVDDALREHLALFDDAHPARLARMRRIALAWMDRLADFHPLATGAVWKGIASEHVPIHLQLFADDPKAVAFRLLDAGVDYDVTTVPHFRRPADEVEALVFHAHGEPVLLSLYAHDDLRGALRAVDGRVPRGDRDALAALAAAEDDAAPLHDAGAAANTGFGAREADASSHDAQRAAGSRGRGARR